MKLDDKVLSDKDGATDLLAEARALFPRHAAGAQADDRPHPFALEIVADSLGRVPDLEEVAPGVFVSRKVIAAAVACTPDQPDEAAEYWNKVDGRVKRLYREAREDLAVSHQIVEALTSQASAREHRKSDAERAMERAVEREQDKSLQFVDVTDRGPAAAAKRVLNVKDSHPEWELEPVDLAGALDDVQPLREATVDVVTYLIRCSRPMDDEELPARLNFIVSDRKADPESPPKLHPYVQLARLPKEVQAVVRTCMMMASTSVTDLSAYDRLCDQVETLRASVAAARPDRARLKVVQEPPGSLGQSNLSLQDALST